jgi:hypothetical protein
LHAFSGHVCSVSESSLRKCKRCFKFINSFLINEGGTRIQMADVASGMNYGDDGDVFEPRYVECMLANLVDRGLVKGYMSREKQMVVLSAKDPFPVLE